MRTVSIWLSVWLVSAVISAPRLSALEENPDAEAAQAGQEEEAKAKEKQRREGVRFQFGRRPSFRVGRMLRVDFRVKFQHDFRIFSPEILGDDGELSELRKMRVGIEGTFLRHFEYELDREIRNEVADWTNLTTNTTRNLWRDAFVNFRYLRRFQIRAGQFKLPFGMDQTSGAKQRDFAFRSLIGDRLAPGRDKGILAHGRLLERQLQYQAGIFMHDGSRARRREIDETGNFISVPTGMRTFAGRLSAPLELFAVPGVIKTAEIGFAFTESAVPEGRWGIQGRTRAGRHNFFREDMFVRGHRLRLGTEFSWQPGPFSLKGEVIRLRDQRKRQGLDDEDLPDLISRGWYVSGTWVVTGEKKAGGIEPRKAFLTGGGLGAFELAARYEALRFGSAKHPGSPSRSFRAANILPNSDRAWTFGINWYLNHYMKIIFNGVRERIEDVQRTPVTDRTLFWSRFIRMQFVL